MSHFKRPKQQHSPIMTALSANNSTVSTNYEHSSDSMAASIDVGVEESDEALCVCLWVYGANQGHVLCKALGKKVKVKARGRVRESVCVSECVRVCGCV